MKLSDVEVLIKDLVGQFDENSDDGNDDSSEAKQGWLAIFLC